MKMEFYIHGEILVVANLAMDFSFRKLFIFFFSFYFKREQNIQPKLETKDSKTKIFIVEETSPSILIEKQKTAMLFPSQRIRLILFSLGKIHPK